VQQLIAVYFLLSFIILDILHKMCLIHKKNEFHKYYTQSVQRVNHYVATTKFLFSNPEKISDILIKICSSFFTDFEKRFRLVKKSQKH